MNLPEFLFFISCCSRRHMKNGFLPFLVLIQDHALSSSFVFYLNFLSLSLFKVDDSNRWFERWWWPTYDKKKNLFKKCCHWKWIIQKYWPLTNYFVLQKKKREEKFSNVGGIGLKHSSLHWRRFSHSGREMCRWGAKTIDLFSLFFFRKKCVSLSLE